MDTNKLIIEAANVARAAHAGQFRKDGKPYFSHVEAVARIVDEDYFNLIPYSGRENWFNNKPYVIAAAFLHDTLEDTSITMEDLKQIGFPPLVRETVEIVTKRAGETYFDFIMRANDSHPFVVAARAVKLADLRHNMSDLPEGAKKDKYRFAEYILSNGLR